MCLLFDLESDLENPCTSLVCVVDEELNKGFDSPVRRVCTVWISEKRDQLLTIWKEVCMLQMKVVSDRRGQCQSCSLSHKNWGWVRHSGLDVDLLWWLRLHVDNKNSNPSSPGMRRDGIRHSAWMHQYSIVSLVAILGGGPCICPPLSSYACVSGTPVKWFLHQRSYGADRDFQTEIPILLAFDSLRIPQLSRVSILQMITESYNIRVHK